MAFSLKRLARDEMDRVAVIHRTAFDERLPWLAGLHTPEEDRAFFRDRVFRECEVWGALDGEAVIGFIAFRPGWVDQLYVLPDRQRRGAGRTLVRLAQAASPELRLWTFERNLPARRFYEAEGFLAVERTDGSRNEAREPDILYAWMRPGHAQVCWTRVDT